MLFVIDIVVPVDGIKRSPTLCCRHTWPNTPNIQPTSKAINLLYSSPVMSEKQIQSSGNSQERLTRPESETVHEKPEQADVPVPPTEEEKNSKSALDPSRSVSEGDIQASQLYTNWQFLTVFVVSCSLMQESYRIANPDSQSLLASMQPFSDQLTAGMEARLCSQ